MSTKGWLRSVAKRVKTDEGLVLRPLIDSYLAGRNRVKDSVDEWVHPSAIGDLENLCPRQVFLSKFTPIEKYPKGLLIQDYTPKTHRIFDVGNLTHIRYQWYMVELGIMDPRRHVGWEVPLEDKSIGLHGHTDGIIYPYTTVRNPPTLQMVPDGHGGHAYPVFTKTGLVFPKAYKFLANGRKAILEVKSMRHGAFQMLFEPMAHHQVQGMAYMATLGIEEAYFIYESKDTQEVKEYHVTLDYKRWGVARKILRGVKQCKDTKTLPDRICHSPYDKRAQKCDFKATCFGNKTYKDLINIEGVPTHHGKKTASKKAGRATKSTRA